MAMEYKTQKATAIIKEHSAKSIVHMQTGDPSTGSGQGFVETKKLILMK